MKLLPDLRCHIPVSESGHCQIRGGMYPYVDQNNVRSEMSSTVRRLSHCQIRDVFYPYRDHEPVRSDESSASTRNRALLGTRCHYHTGIRTLSDRGVIYPYGDQVTVGCNVSSVSTWMRALSDPRRLLSISGVNYPCGDQFTVKSDVSSNRQDTVRYEVSSTRKGIRILSATK
ncbi:hypothetical protein CHS0354_038297 [Potamilus streckersoni]|uniref:Uncharacterized protein n=1 Tax=Potamilus streckersoni TaxID=2493646 RepID=A0AAE0TCI4_9BIVA|nr:hypothetical protein CHS0354_038297 [Potamilus streckersoni]